MKNNTFVKLLYCAIFYCVSLTAFTQEAKYSSVEQFMPFVLEWEGGYYVFSKSFGGATNMGITLSTWKSVGYDKNGDGVIDTLDLKLLSKSDVKDFVLKPFYWDRWKADSIKEQSVANILVDWLWTSGMQGIKIPQAILQVKADGIVGNNTLSALNNYPDQEELFYKLKDARIEFIHSLCLKNSQALKYKKGWINRINAIKYEKQ